MRIEKSFKNYRKYCNYAKISRLLGNTKKVVKYEKIYNILWDKLTDLSNDDKFIEI